jgi:hypothetical protein
MTTDYYSKAVKKRAKETTTEQDTPQDKGRLKITPTMQENQDKEQHRRATTGHRKAIPKEHEWDYQEESIEGCDYDKASCRCLRNEFRHRFTSPDECMVEWLRIQHGNSQEMENYRKMITNRTSDCTSGSGCLVKTPTVLKALKRTLQELLGSDRWYETLTMGCMMTVWDRSHDGS